jgi:ethanolamine utilization protein EutA
VIPAAQPASGEALWRAENVDFTTVGIDIGSATSHLQFSRVRLQRRARGLSSRFAVIERSALRRSPVVLTPYRTDGSIDSAALGRFAESELAAAGLTARQVDSGAVILTGEALKSQNARPLAAALAENAGVFVCATAGHHLEAKLAAHGSGAVALSARTGQVVAHLDVGGGTTKLALLRGGRVLATAAVAVGGRLLVFDRAGALARVSEAGAHLARAAGVEPARGRAVSAAGRGRVAAEMARLLVSLLEDDIPDRHRPLLLTGRAAAGQAAAGLVPAGLVPEIVTFSGGVSEYLYGRASADHGDLGADLAEAIGDVMARGRLPWPPPDPGEGIRATVIGASQFSVEVSGNTICVPDPAKLPLRDVPVAVPGVDLSGEVDAPAVARQVGAEWRRLLAGAAQEPVALAFRWHGDPSHQRLRSLAEGIVAGTRMHAAGAHATPPVVVLIDGDVGRGLGRILLDELGTDRFICLDCVEVAEFDYVDVGSVAQPAGVVPVVVKSLLFGG